MHERIREEEEDMRGERRRRGGREGDGQPRIKIKKFHKSFIRSINDGHQRTGEAKQNDDCKKLIEAKTMTIITDDN